jgi:hypothetical protein
MGVKNIEDVNAGAELHHLSPIGKDPLKLTVLTARFSGFRKGS